jgi:tetratricopeptide (TPR) repeat protein
MDRRQFADALGKFQTACILDTQSDVGCLNMGIAFLQMQRWNDAQRVLTKAIALDPQNPRAWFNLGLLEQTIDEPESAIRDFAKVAALDPSDANTQYFLGELYSASQQYAKATAAFSQAVKLNPFFASAELGLAQVAQQAGDTDNALAHLTRFRHIISENLGQPTRAAYGEQGKYSRAQELPRTLEDVPPAIPVHFVDVTSTSGLEQPFKAATTSAHRNEVNNELHANTKEGSGGTSSDWGAPKGALASFLGSGACIIDYNGDGNPDIFLVNADGRGNAALYRNAGHERFANETKAAKLDFQGLGTGCAVGDYDNDGHPDLAVSSNRGVTLYHNLGNGTFEDGTDAAGLRATGLVLGLTFLDYDHDGNLDLYATRFDDFPLDHPHQPFSFPRSDEVPGNMLWRNTGHGKFVDWTKETAAGGTFPSVGAIETDVNNDHAADLVVEGWQKSPSVLLNEPEGAFRAESPWTTEMPGPTAGAISLDFDKDGWMDLAFTHWSPPGLSLWHNLSGKSFQRVQLPGPQWMRGWGVAPIDYDNDGWIDLVAVGETFAGEGRIILLRNEGRKGFRDVTQETGLGKIELHDPRSVIACDFDGDGSADLLVTQNNRPPVLLKNTGASEHNWLQIALTGVLDSNTGIGTEVEVLAGAHQQKWLVPGASGYLGQGPSEILAGLGSENEVDVLRLFWPTGILQDEMQIRGGRREVITESDPRDAQR